MQLLVRLPFLIPAIHTGTIATVAISYTIENIAERVLHLFFDCSPTPSLSGWPGDLFLYMTLKQAERDWGRYAYHNTAGTLQTFPPAVVMEIVLLFDELFVAM